MNSYLSLWKKKKTAADKEKMQKFQFACMMRCLKTPSITPRKLIGRTWPPLISPGVGGHETADRLCARRFQLVTRRILILQSPQTSSRSHCLTWSKAIIVKFSNWRAASHNSSMSLDSSHLVQLFCCYFVDACLSHYILRAKWFNIKAWRHSSKQIYSGGHFLKLLTVVQHSSKK